MTESTPAERAAQHHAATLMHDAARNIPTAAIAAAIAGDDQLAHLTDGDTETLTGHIAELIATADFTTDFTQTQLDPLTIDVTAWDEP